MSRMVTVELPEEVYDVLVDKASQLNRTPEDLIAENIKRFFPARDERLRSLFGSVDLGAPLFASNEDLDDELAREYLDTHDEE